MSENRNRQQEWAETTAEELEKRYRETFFYTDKIDETVYWELERLGEALEEKRGGESALTAEESWERFARVHADEIARCCRQAAQTKMAAGSRRYRAVFRSALIAAALLVLLAGAALAADSLGLAAWVPRWNGTVGRYEPAAEEIAGRPIPAALGKLGITEPVYPARLPKGFVLTESHISKDPLVLMEQYAKGNQTLSITVTPIKGFQTAVYQSGGDYREYRSDKAVHYLFRNEGTVIAVWYTKHYATTVSGNLPLEEIETIMESMEASSEGGSLT